MPLYKVNLIIFEKQTNENNNNVIIIITTIIIIIIIIIFIEQELGITDLSIKMTNIKTILKEHMYYQYSHVNYTIF